MLHNYFEISCGQKKQRGYNTFFGAAEQIKEGKLFTKYIVLGSGGGCENGRLKNEVFRAEAEITEINTDPLFGRLYAVKSAAVDDSANLSGISLSEAAFSDGESIVNYAVFDPIIKEQGKTLVITGKLYLDAAADGLNFTGGDNKLVRALLGLEPLKGASFTIAGGNNFYANRIIPRSKNNIFDEKSADTLFSQNALSFSAEFDKDIFEAVLYMDGEAVLRCTDEDGYGTISEARAVSRIGSFVTADNSVEVFDVTSGGSPVYYEAYSYYSFMTADCPQLFEGKLPKNSKMISDSTGNFAAVCTPYEITVYGIDGGKLLPLYTADWAAEASLCADGSLFLHTKPLAAYIWADGQAQKKEYAFSPDKFAAAYTAGYHYLVFTERGFLYRYRLSDEGETLINKTPSPADYEVYHIAGGIICEYSNFAATVYAGTLYGINSKLTDWLKNIRIESDTVKIIEQSGYLAYLVMKGTGYMLNYMNNKVHRLFEGDKPYLIDGVGFVYTKQGRQTVMVPDMSNLGVKYLVAPGIAQDFKGGARIGDFLLVQNADDTVTTYYLMPSAKTVICPSLSDGAAVSFGSVIKKGKVSQGYGKTKANMTLVFGGSRTEEGIL